MTRRTFVAAALVQPPPRPIKIAFLGTGHSHAQAKIEIVRKSPQWELAAVAAGNDLKLRDAILADPSIEAVAADLAGTRALLDAARRNRRLLQLGYMWRHHPGINKALELARQGTLGDIYLVRGTINTLIDAAARREWAQFPGGQMFEQGCHLLDPAVRLLGQPLRVTPFLRTHGNFNDTLKDNTAAVLEYPRALAIITSSVLQPNAGPHRSFEIFGSKGSAVLRPIEPALLELDLAQPAGRQTIPLPPYRRYEADFAELAQCIRENKPLSVTPDEDLLVHQVILQASNMS